MMQRMAKEIEGSTTIQTSAHIDANLATGLKCNWTMEMPQSSTNKKTYNKVQRTNGASTKKTQRANVDLPPMTPITVFQCPLLAQPCLLDDLLEFNGRSKICVEH